MTNFINSNALLPEKVFFFESLFKGHGTILSDVSITLWITNETIFHGLFFGKSPKTSKEYFFGRVRGVA